MSNQADNEFLAYETTGMFQDPLKKAEERLAATKKRNAVAEVNMGLAEAEYTAGQNMQMAALEPIQADADAFMAEIETSISDADAQKSFQAAYGDQTRKERFGANLQDDGLPGSLVASRRHYADMLHKQDVMRDQSGAYPIAKVIEMDGRTAASRDHLVDSYKTNLGMTSEQATNRVDELFKDVEPGITGDSVTYMKRIWGDKSVGQRAFDQLHETFAEKPMAILRTLGALPTAISATGLSVAPEYYKSESVEEWGKKVVGEDAEPGAIQVAGYLAKHGAAIGESVKTGFKSLYSGVTGVPQTEDVYQEFAKHMTNDPKKQRYLTMAMPFAEVTGYVGLEIAAAKTAAKYVDYFYRKTTLDRFAEWFVAGTPGSWRTEAQLQGIAANAAHQAAQTKRNLHNVVPHGPEPMPAGYVAPPEVVAIGADTGKAHGPTGNPDTGKVHGPNANPADKVITPRHPEVHDGPPPISEADMVGMDSMNILADIANGNLTSPSTRAAAEQIVENVRSAEGISEESLKIADTLEAQLKEAEGQLINNTGKEGPVSNKVIPASGPDTFTQSMIDELVVKHDIKHEKGKSFGSMTSKGMRYNENLTRDEFLGFVPVSLANNGVPKEVMAKLVSNDEQARLFVILHEEGHKLAGDHLRNIDTVHPITREQRIAATEKYAMEHALNRYSGLTGKKFHNIEQTELTHASFLNYDPASGAFTSSLVPKPDMIGKPADEGVSGFFRAMEKNPNPNAAVNGLAVEVKASGKGVKRGPGVDPSSGDVVDDFIPLDEFNEMGEALGVFFRPAQEGAEAFGRRVYEAFVKRYAVTPTQAARGDLKHPDMTVGFGQYRSKAQMDKMENLINSWRGVKEMNARAKGTDQEANALNLARWFQSNVADSGRIWQMTSARIKSWNREAISRSTGVDFTGKSASRSQPADTGIGTRVVESEGGGDELMVRSLYHQTPKGSVDPRTAQSMERSGGHVFSDEAADGAGGQATDGVTRREAGRGERPGEAYGPQEAAATETAPDDAMAKAVSFDDLKKFDEDGKEVSIRGVEDVDTEGRIMKDRYDQQQALNQQPELQGPVSLTTHSLLGTAEEIRVSDLENFAGVGATDALPGQVFGGGSINIFHTDSSQLSGAWKSMSEKPGGKAQINALRKDFTERQIGGMAKRIAAGEAGPEEMVLFDRSLAIAKVMKEVEETGQVSGATAKWLDMMDLKAAGGETIEEGILAGLKNAESSQTFAYNVMNDAQRANKVDVADVVSKLPSGRRKDDFIADYVDRMAGEEMSKLRKTLNDARRVIIERVGGPCA